jgi:hypothetical protein
LFTSWQRSKVIPPKNDQAPKEWTRY